MRFHPIGERASASNRRSRPDQPYPASYWIGAAMFINSLVQKKMHAVTNSMMRLRRPLIVVRIHAGRPRVCGSAPLRSSAALFGRYHSRLTAK